MEQRKIARTVAALKVNMGGNILDQPLPVNGLDQVDPFLLIHHWKDVMPGHQKQRDVGVGPHPHRGFSPVTFIFEGSLQHRDSLGNDATVYSGGTQWMHAGRGITHSERPDATIAAEGGPLEFIQFWVNTPAKHKMDIPFYLPLSDEKTPRVIGDGFHLAVVAGEYEGVKGAAPVLSPMTLLRGEVHEGKTLDIHLPESFNIILYALDGSMTVNGSAVKGKDMVVLEPGEGGMEIQAKETSRFIILSGEPLNEEVTSYGPFVMNNQTQIMEALRDAQTGKMGILIEEF